VKTPPEPLLTLEEACQQYFPGKTPCALRWMIKRRGYAHSRWGCEYRLTPSQIAAIVDDAAVPAKPSSGPLTGAMSSRRSRSPARTARVLSAASAGAAVRGEVPGSQAGRRTLEERLSTPLSADTA
jgi:hypothetical protein